MGLAVARLVFQPPASSYSKDDDLVWLKTKRGNEIPAFHCKSHGNAEDIGMSMKYFEHVSTIWNVNVFAYEYSGYGCSTGTPTENNVYADIEAAYEYLTLKLHIPASKIVAYGRSLGTGPSVHLASNYPVAGVILQSPLLSVHRVAVNLGVTLPGDMFCNIDKIGKIRCPVFLIHGMRDEVVPFSHSLQLLQACPTAVSPYWIEKAGHNDVELVGRERFILNMWRFLAYLRHPEMYRKRDFQLCKDPKALLSLLLCKKNNDCEGGSGVTPPLRKANKTARARHTGDEHASKENKPRRSERTPAEGNVHMRQRSEHRQTQRTAALGHSTKPLSQHHRKECRHYSKTAQKGYKLSLDRQPSLDALHESSPTVTASTTVDGYCAAAPTYPAMTERPYTTSRRHSQKIAPLTVRERRPSPLLRKKKRTLETPLFHHSLSTPSSYPALKEWKVLSSEEHSQNTNAVRAATLERSANQHATQHGNSKRRARH